MILVVFLAGYLSENRPLLVEESTKVGPISLPPLPYLAPMVAMWAIALGIVVVQRDLGAALLFFAVFLLLLYVGDRPASATSCSGSSCSSSARSSCTSCCPTSGRASTSGSTRSRSPQATGYQIVQALYAFGRGGLLGTGLGAGLPTIGGSAARSRRSTRTSRSPRSARSSGLVGILAILGLYLVVIERGLRIAASAARRLPVAARRRSGARHRRPGVHHRGRQPQADPADRDHAAVHQLRRLVAARERDRRRTAARPVGPGRRAAAAARPPSRARRLARRLGA